MPGSPAEGLRIAALIDADPRPDRHHDPRPDRARHRRPCPEIVSDQEIARSRSRDARASVAQDVCDRLVEAGVTSILNFAPVVLSVPEHVDVRKVDLAAELQILSFHETRAPPRSSNGRFRGDERQAKNQKAESATKERIGWPTGPSAASGREDG